MKIPKLVVAIVAALSLTASSGDVTGTWKAVFTGPKDQQPKAFKELVLNLNTDGAKLTGTAHMGSWPGDAPITDGKIEGEHISFTAIGKLGSSSGFPKMGFAGTVHGGEMKLTMSWGYVGRDDATAKLLPMQGRKLAGAQ